VLLVADVVDGDVWTTRGGVFGRGHSYTDADAVACKLPRMAKRREEDGSTKNFIVV
jgi:hypothetical protein